MINLILALVFNLDYICKILYNNYYSFSKIEILHNEVIMERNNWLIHFELVVMFVTIVGGFYTIDSRIDNCNNRMDQFLIAWHEESKDFHGRLCAIEERNRGR